MVILRRDDDEKNEQKVLGVHGRALQSLNMVLSGYLIEKKARE